MFYLPMALMMSLILGSGLAAFTSCNSALAQNYGYQNDSYGNDGSSSHKGEGRKIIATQANTLLKTKDTSVEHVHSKVSL